MSELPCPRCGEHAAVALAAGCEATVGSVAGVVGQLPRIRCSAGHDVPVTAAPAALGDARLHLQQAMPHARARALRRDERCSNCGGSLTMPVRRTEWPVTFERPAGLPVVVTVRLDVPATRCPGCGTDHVPVRSQRDLEATVEALLSGDP